MASTVGVYFLLFENDLRGRIKQVKVGDDLLPDQQEARRRVQQGSVPGPLFFSCFVLLLFCFVLFLLLLLFFEMFF